MLVHADANTSSRCGADSSYEVTVNTQDSADAAVRSVGVDSDPPYPAGSEEIP